MIFKSALNCYAVTVLQIVGESVSGCVPNQDELTFFFMSFFHSKYFKEITPIFYINIFNFEIQGFLFVVNSFSSLCICF